MTPSQQHPSLSKLRQEKILHLVDTQPRIEPDLLEVISMPRPTPTEEEQEAHAKVSLLKNPPPPPHPTPS